MVSSSIEGGLLQIVHLFIILDISLIHREIELFILSIVFRKFSTKGICDRF